MTDSVTIYAAKSLTEALLLKGRLESAGVPALVPGSFEMGYGLLEAPDTRVQVAAEHEAKAKEVLQAWLRTALAGEAEPRD